MRVPAGLKRLDDRVLGARGSGTGGTRTGGDRSERHEHVYPEDEERSVAKSEQTTERTERTERTGGDEAAEERPARRGNGDGLQKVLATVWRISRLVFLALALVLLLAVALLLLPANEDNVIVRNVLDLAETVAGPFKDVFTVDDPERMRIYNYGLAAAVYFVLSVVVSKLPTGPKRKKG